MTTETTKQPPCSVVFRMDDGKTEALRLTNNGMWVGTGLTAGDTARAVVDAINSYVKAMVQQAVEEEREKDVGNET